MDKILHKIKRIIPTKLFKFFQPVYHFSLSFFAAVACGRPSEKMAVIGVTGTTGKTSIVYLLAQVLKDAGYKVGYTSTAMFSDGDKEWLNDKKMTMVGRFFSQRLLKQMLKNNCQYAIVETTSEGVRQFRHRFINYDILVFSGLYPEHIESHGSFEAYKKAKGELFRHLKRCRVKYCDENKNVCLRKNNLGKLDLNRLKKTIVVNGDDEHSDYFLSFWAERKIAYLKNKKKKKEKTDNLIYKNIKTEKEGVSFETEKGKINLKILGEFNAVNAMASYAVAFSQGLEFEKIKKGLEEIKGIPGRLEKIDEGQDFEVIVDYAFEPEAVKKLYETVAVLKPKKIIHILGSTGGGRDRARRPELGKLAGERADFVIITNEDPYDEDPGLIIREVAFGAEKVGAKKEINLFEISDRREAIKKAFSLAKKDDLVLITGKGSEQAICAAGGEKIKWDDREVAREELKRMV